MLTNMDTTGDVISECVTPFDIIGTEGIVYNGLAVKYHDLKHCGIFNRSNCDVQPLEVYRRDPYSQIGIATGSPSSQKQTSAALMEEWIQCPSEKVLENDMKSKDAADLAALVEFIACDSRRFRWLCSDPKGRRVFRLLLMTLGGEQCKRSIAIIFQHFTEFATDNVAHLAVCDVLQLGTPMQRRAILQQLIRALPLLLGSSYGTAVVVNSITGRSKSYNGAEISRALKADEELLQQASQQPHFLQICQYMPWLNGINAPIVYP